MSQQLGRLLLIKIVTATLPRTVENLCGLRTRTFNLSANEVDRTIPNCINPGGPVQRRTRPGISQRSFSGSGLFVSGTVAAMLLDHVRAATAFEADVVVPGDGTYSGQWMVANFEYSGEMEDDLNFSASFSAADELTFTPEGGAPVNVIVPAIAGIAQQGQQAIVRPGQYSGGSPVLSWQWQVDDEGWEDIPGASGHAFTYAAGQVGKQVRVAETATTSGGSVTAYSAPTAAVLSE